MEAGLTSIAGYLGRQSWQIALLVIAVGLASWALRNRSAHVRYLLWLLVLAKCLTPPVVQVPLAVLPAQTPEAIAPMAPTSPPQERVAAPPTQERPLATSSPVSPPSPRLSMGQRLAVAWLAGVAAFTCVALTKAGRTILWLRRERRTLPWTSGDSFEETFRSLRVKRPPRIWLIEGIGQPFVWGILRGDIYLPNRFARIEDDEHRRDILAHEISHVLRFDAAVNILQIIAQGIFWFHPLLWWANQRIRREREKCCDEMAIAHLGAKPKDYSSAIISTLIQAQESARPVPSLAVAGPVKNIEERIRTMLRPGKEFYKRPSLVAATIVLLLALLTVPTALVLSVKAQSKTTGMSLHEAAAAGDIEQVKSLLAKGADVNAKDKPMRGTALHYAAKNSHPEVAKLLISQGAYVNAMDRRAETPLHYASLRGDKKTVELLLSKGADVNTKNWRVRTPLFEAMTSSATGRKEVVELLAAKGARVPALHLAAYLGDMEKLQQCLQDGTDTETQSECGSTALHAAANSGRKDIVESLISKGAQVDAKDGLGVTPLYYAAMHNYEDIADLLLAKGADVNAKDKDGHYTLLCYAIWDSSKDAIKLLISKGANVNVKDSGGHTPLVNAVWEDDKDMVGLLLSKGADVNAEDNEGVTPYYWAALQGSKDLVQLLTAKGATPASAIHVAASAGDLASVKRLINEGTDVNAKDKLGRTPLFSAASAGNNDVAEFLIAKGADVNAKEKNGQGERILTTGRIKT